MADDDTIRAPDESRQVLSSLPQRISEHFSGVVTSPLQLPAGRKVGETPEQTGQTSLWAPACQSQPFSGDFLFILSNFSVPKFPGEQADPDSGGYFES